MFKNLTKAQVKKIQLLTLSISLFLISLISLSFLPQTVQLAETKIASVNQINRKPLLLGDMYVESSNSSEEFPNIKVIDQKIPPPTVSAASVYVEDLSTQEVLFKKNLNIKVPPASTTKIMTAIVASQYYKSGDILVVPSEALVGGSNMGLVPGENMTFRSLLYGMLLNSGNDAAFTLAINYPGGLEGFVSAMNQKAKDLNLKNTHFVNPAGFDNPNHYSSSEDMAIIAKELIKNPYLSKIVSTKETSVISFDKTKSHPLKNLNKLLEEKGFIGIKTGFTQQAGENLVGLVDKDGHKILTVVLNSTDRFGESKALVDWVFSNFKWE